MHRITGKGGWGKARNILETPRCLIRETTTADGEDFYRIYSHPAITKYMEGLYPEVEQEKQYVRLRTAVLSKRMLDMEISGIPKAWHGSPFGITQQVRLSRHAVQGTADVGDDGGGQLAFAPGDNIVLGGAAEKRVQPGPPVRKSQPRSGTGRHQF